MLVALWDVSNQFNDNNGSILTNGKIYVYYSGRAALAPTWSSADGSHVNSNPIILDNNGRAVAFADDQYTYTCVVCDFYGRELFSFDPASFGTGGGGSTTEGNDAAHWIGATGTDVHVTALADTLLPLPSSPDYEGDFVGQTTYTTISLNKGLYMVDADIRIQQDDDDLENIIKDISVYTGLTGPDSLTTSQKNWTGPEASDDRHFVHVHFIRHIADEGEDLYFQMNSPVDLSQAWIEKLSIVKLTEGGNGKSYVGGYGIDIRGPVISVSGMIPEASAANFVDLSTYNTDIENIYETIAETSAMIPSGVATEQWVTDYTSAFITEDALYGYATQQWVEDQHYITSADIPPIPEDVVTSGELATVSGDIMNEIPSYTAGSHIDITNNEISVTGVSGLFAGENVTITTSGGNYYINSTGGDVPVDVVTSAELATVSGDIVSQIPSLDGYATQQWVGEQGYLTEIPPEYVTQTEMENYTSAFITSADLPSLDGYATQSWVEDQHYITSADIPDVPEDLVTSAELASTSAELESMIPSLDGYATEQFVEDYTSAFITESDIPADLVSSGELATVSGEIVNQIPDTSDMATQTWVNQQGFITSLPEDLATSGDLATVSGDIMSQMPTQTTVSIDPTLSSGTKIAEFNINGTSGELFAPDGGSVEGGLEAVSFPMVINDDKTYIAMRYSQRGLKAEVTYEYYYPTRVSGKYIYPCIPWDMARSTEPGAVLCGSICMERSYSLTNCRVAWFPTTDTDKFLIDLRSRFRYRSGISTSWAYCPPSTSPDYPVDTTNWTKVGDWSSITGPIIEWYVGIVDVTDNTLYEITQLGYQRNANTLEPAIGRGLTWTSRTGYNAAPDQYDIAVTNPVPNATNNQGYVLTENGDGTFGWAAPAGGGSEVDIIPSIQTGTKIADYVIDGTSGALYAPAGGGSTYYAGDHIVIDQNNYISTSGLMVENSAFMIDSAGYANRVSDGAAETLNVGTVSNDPLQVIGMQDDIEYTLNCSGNTDGIRIYQGHQWDYGSATTKYPTNNEIKFTKSDFNLVSSTGNYYLCFANPYSGLIGNNVTLSYGGGGNTRYALVTDLPTPGQLIPSGGTNGQVVTKSSSGPVWTTPFQGIYNSSTAIRPNSVEVVTSLPVSPDAGRIYLIPES